MLDDVTMCWWHRLRPPLLAPNNTNVVTDCCNVARSPDFKKLDTDERWDWTMEEILCFFYLVAKHRKVACKANESIWCRRLYAAHSSRAAAQVNGDRWTGSREPYDRTWKFHSSSPLLKSRLLDQLGRLPFMPFLTVTLLDSSIAGKSGIVGKWETLSMCWINGVPSM